MNDNFGRILKAMKECESNELYSKNRRLSLVAYYLVGRFSMKFSESDAEHITELLRND